MSWLTTVNMYLTHWGWVTHICISKLTSIGSDNDLSPGRRQAIIWTNAGILLIWPLGTNFSEILIEIHTFLFKKMHLKMSSGKCRPFCLGLNVLNTGRTFWKQWELRLGVIIAFHFQALTVKNIFYVSYDVAVPFYLPTHQAIYNDFFLFKNLIIIPVKYIRL